MGQVKLNGQTTSFISISVQHGISGLNLRKHKCLQFICEVKHKKLLSSLTESQLGDYSKLKTTLTDRYDPKEKESLYRCQFRQFKREKGVSSSDYGYALSKLAQKAYPKLTLHQLEVPL